MLYESTKFAAIVNGWTLQERYINLQCLKTLGNHLHLYWARFFQILLKMPRPKKTVQASQNQGAGENADNSKVEMIKNNELTSLIAGKCRYLSQLMTTSSKAQEIMMEEQWQQKINDRLLKYPHIPGAKLFNKLSSECWNEVYYQNEEIQTYYKNVELRDDQLQDELKKISAEIKGIEEKNNVSYSL